MAMSACAGARSNLAVAHLGCVCGQAWYIGETRRQVQKLWAFVVVCVKCAASMQRPSRVHCVLLLELGTMMSAPSLWAAAPLAKISSFRDVTHCHQREGRGCHVVCRRHRKWLGFLTSPTYLWDAVPSTILGVQSLGKPVCGCRGLSFRGGGAAIGASSGNPRITEASL